MQPPALCSTCKGVCGKLPTSKAVWEPNKRPSIGFNLKQETGEVVGDKELQDVTGHPQDLADVLSVLPAKKLKSSER